MCSFKQRMALIVASCFVVTISLGTLAIAKERTLRISAEAWYFKKYKLYDAAEKFQKDHPDVKVEYTKIGDFETAPLMLMWSRGRTNADLAIVAAPPDAAPFVAKDLVIDFEDLFTGDFSKDKWLGAFLDECVIKGKIYVLPTDSEVMSLTVRKDLLAELGLVDKKGNIIPAKSLAELYDYARKLTTKDAAGKTTRYGLDVNWDIAYMPFTYLSGLQATRGNIFAPDGTTIDFASKEALDLLTWWHRGVKEGYFSSGSLVDHNSPRSGMKAGTNAMIWVDQGRWIECGQVLGPEKATVMPIPGSVENGTLVYSMSMMVPKVSPNIDLVKQFIKEQLWSKWFNQWTLVNYGKMTALKRNYAGMLEDPGWKTIFQLAENEKTVYTPKYKDYPKLVDIMTAEIQSMLNLYQTPEKTLENIQNQIKGLDLAPVE